MTFKEWNLLLFLSILWGISFFFVGIEVQSLPPFTIVAFRVSFAALFFYLILWFQGLRLPNDIQIIGMFFVMGLINNAIPFSLIVVGQKYVASSLASILNATTPIFTIFIAHFFTKDEKFSLARIFGVLLGFLGVSVVIGLKNLSFEALAPQLLIISATISYAFASVFGKKFHQRGIKPLVVATGQLSMSSLILLPIAIFFEDSIQLPSVKVWVVIFSFSFFSTTFAYLIYFRLLATIGANNVMLVTVLAPISAVILGVTFLGEKLLIRHLIGLVIIVLALLIIDQRIFSKKKIAKKKLKPKNAKNPNSCLSFN